MSNNDRWDHGGYDQILREEQEALKLGTNSVSVKKFANSNKNGEKQQQRKHNDHTMMADIIENRNNSFKKKKQQASNDLWLHDKAHLFENKDDDNAISDNNSKDNIKNQARPDNDSNEFGDKRKKGGKYQKQYRNENKKYYSTQTQGQNRPRDNNTYFYNGGKQGGGSKAGRKVYMKQDDWRNTKKDSSQEQDNSQYRRKSQKASNNDSYNEENKQLADTPSHKNEEEYTNTQENNTEIDIEDDNPIVLIITLETENGPLNVNIYKNDNTYEVAERICHENKFSHDLIAAIALQINKALGLNPFHQHPISSPMYNSNDNMGLYYGSTAGSSHGMGQIYQ